MKTTVSIILFSLLFTGCSRHVVSDSDRLDTERFVLTTLWMQTAAECRALQLQAFNIARERIHEYFSKNKLNGNEIIILDIDETVLETTSYQARMISGNFMFPIGWEEYLNEADCRPIPGALEFLRYADSLGVKIFYISNREEYQRKPTIQNLEKFSFPQLSSERVLLKSDESSKEKRRNLLERNYNILLLIGDNLGDFSDFLNSGSYLNRSEKVSEMSDKFGLQYIILPNSSYGDWEKSLAPGYWNFNSAQRDSIRKEILKKYSGRN